MKTPPFEVDKDSPVPIYFQLQRGLIRLIESGIYSPGQLLPSETELSRTFRISPMTVRQAMAELVSQGYVNRRKGRGTFVSPRRLPHQLERLIGFSEDMRSRSLTPSAQTLLIEQAPPPPDVRVRLSLSADALMTRIKRVRLANGEPVGIHDSFVHGVNITYGDLEQTPSLYQLLAQRGIELGEGEDVIDATAASQEAAQLLGVKVGSPLLRTTRYSWDVKGRFVEYVVALYHADLYQYRIRLRR